jgi:molecular chaperone GrpE (heat shock protein)
MKTTVQKWLSGVSRFLTGVPDDNRQVVHEGDRRLPVHTDAVELTDRHDVVGREPPTAVAVEEIEGPKATDPDAAGGAETISPTPPAMSNHPMPVGANGTAPDEARRWLGDQFLAISKQLESQAEGLRNIKEAVARAEVVRSQMEEQEEVIQELAGRLRGAEEREVTSAVMEPVVSGLIQMFDTVWSARQSWKEQRPGNIDEWVIDCLGTLDGEIVDMLDRCGVSLIQEAGTVPNLSRQRVIDTEPVRQFRDGEVLKRGKPGFIYNGRVRRPEEVITAVTIQGGVR